MKDHIIDVVFVLEDLVTAVRTLNDTLLEFKETKSKKAATKIVSMSTSYTIAFNEWWDTYPKLPRTGKVKAFHYWCNLFSNSPSLERLKELKIATENYASHIVTHGRLARDPERFLKENWWKGWLNDGDYKSSDTAGDDEECTSGEVDSTSLEQRTT